MKKIICLFALASFVTSSYCQNAQKVDEKDVPPQIIQQFKKTFADAKNTKWTKLENKFEAVLLHEDMNTVVQYGSTGDWQNTKWEMPVKYLSPQIDEYIKKKYADYKVKTLYLQDTQANVRFYIVTVEKKKEKIELYFGLDFAFVKQVPEPAKKDNTATPPKTDNSGGAK
ncbi:MAG: PepSY-like domain-containing protein [Bacteroidales bacterium]|nr:PepSY-like domain-containing protein [Bacteroidales bacterium]